MFNQLHRPSSLTHNAVVRSYVNQCVEGWDCVTPPTTLGVINPLVVGSGQCPLAGVSTGVGPCVGLGYREEEDKKQREEKDDDFNI